jgi:hypothetical protein
MNTFKRFSISHVFTIDHKDLVGWTTPITRKEKDECSKANDEQEAHQNQAEVVGNYT